MDEIQKFEKSELAWNGKPVRSTEEQITKILVPMFALFPNTNADKFTFDAYVRMLRDLEPEVLRMAVLKAMNSCKFLPTVADIREQIEYRHPGPHSNVDPTTLPPVPQKMFRLPEAEDRAERMERLRQTQKWGKYYGERQ